MEGTNVGKRVEKSATLVLQSSPFPIVSNATYRAETQVAGIEGLPYSAYFVFIMLNNSKQETVLSSIFRGGVEISVLLEHPSFLLMIHVLHRKTLGVVRHVRASGNRRVAALLSWRQSSCRLARIGLRSRGTRTMTSQQALFPLRMTQGPRRTRVCKCKTRCIIFWI